MNGRIFFDGYDTGVSAEARLLLMLSWSIRQGAPAPVVIGNLGWPQCPVSVAFDCVRSVYTWARQFGLGVQVSNTHSGGYEYAESEVLRIYDRDVVFSTSAMSPGEEAFAAVSSIGDGEGVVHVGSGQ